jgi:hypothetical protein
MSKAPQARLIAYSIRRRKSSCPPQEGGLSAAVVPPMGEIGVNRLTNGIRWV